MKKLLNTALVLILAAVFSSCGGSEGKITLTDIPSKYNGNYIILEAQDSKNDIFIAGLKEFDTENDNHWIVPISGGKAEIPVWLIESYDEYSRYTGSDTIELSIIIFSEERLNSNMLAFLYYESVTFKNGSVIISFKDADYFVEQ